MGYYLAVSKCWSRASRGASGPLNMQNNTVTASTSPTSFTRRQFLRRTALAAGAATLSFPYVGRVLGANDRINVACIGVGGKGNSDSSHAASCGGYIVAICDVDDNPLASKAKQFAEQFPQLKQYKDYRKLLDEIGKDIDAVTVSTPDHQHGVAAIRAMKSSVRTSTDMRSLQQWPLSIGQRATLERATLKPMLLQRLLGSQPRRALARSSAASPPQRPPRATRPRPSDP